ncbi:DNA helicase PIF1, ATP-dependent [Corchorus olitorius]|uniref:ATP-dependent DNA helicase n=1 Tax=Corchorus olitorius TaxID=93759 RepID=A0A1R3J3H1_9ROSI|nr:DNA helicase PIF1, ATP-dependent [Corchorus olitorius]
MREYYAYRLQQRDLQSNTLLRGGRLFQQYIIDAFSCIDFARLTHNKIRQQEARSDMFVNVRDAVYRGDLDASNLGKRIILPVSYTGGPRYMFQNYQDAMAICRVHGYPTLFITFTSNPKWSEIQEALDLIPGQKVEDKPDLVVRVFRLKLKSSCTISSKESTLGTSLHKRGLPHAHILLWLDAESRWKTTSDIDEIICVELPDPSIDKIGFDAVSTYMMHGPCGRAFPSAPCMSEGDCSKYFPKPFQPNTVVDNAGFAIYRRRDMGITCKNGGVELDNRFAVPHNVDLCVRFSAHINVEICSPTAAIKYLFKNVNKGPDRARITLEPVNHSQNQPNQLSDQGCQQPPVNEIEMYLDARYLAAHEACWRIYEFDIHYRDPAVQRLLIHLPDQQYVYFHDRQSLQKVLARPQVGKTMFTEWMATNKKFPEARRLLYTDFPNEWVWLKDECVWKKREQGRAIGRIMCVPPCSGKTFLWNAIISALRSQELIVFAVVSSGIASLLMPGGRIAHSRFKIPIDISDCSTCTIPKGTKLARLLKRTSLIVSDEAPMIHRHCVEALDKTLRDVLFDPLIQDEPKPFARPYFCRKRNLDDFARWLLDISDGSVESVNYDPESQTSTITIPTSLLIECEGSPIHAIFHSVYQSFRDHYSDPLYLHQRAIVTPYNDTVTEINWYALTLVPGSQRTYLSCDTLSKTSQGSYINDILYSPELLNSLKLPGVPDHELYLKIGAIVSLRHASSRAMAMGQTLKFVGLYLPRPVFAHGQLYVALSRVTSFEGLKILIHDSDGNATNQTSNVVYKEISDFTTSTSIMEPKEITIPQLRRGGVTDYIILRIARRWDTIFPNTNQFVTIDFLLTDDIGHAIHAYMDSSLGKNFSTVLYEGCLYKISVFQVKGPKSSHNAVPGTNTLMIYWSTSIDEIHENVDRFPRHYFVFANFDNMRSRWKKDRVMTDAIGMLVGITRVCKIKVKKHDNEVNQITILLRLLSGDEVKVVLWNKFSAKLDVDALLKERPKPVMIIVGTTVKGQDDTDFYLTTTTGSKILVNPTTMEALQIRERYQYEMSGVQLIETDDQRTGRDPTVTAATESRIIQLLGLDPSQIGTNKFKIIANVTGIDTSGGWFYTTFPICSSQMLDGHGKLYCGEHKHQKPKLIVRLPLLVRDATAKLRLTIFGDLARVSIEGMPILADSESVQLPQQAYKILDNEYEFVVGLSKKSLRRGELNFKLLEGTVEDLSLNTPVKRANTVEELILATPVKDLQSGDLDADTPQKSQPECKFDSDPSATETPQDDPSEPGEDMGSPMKKAKKG